MKRFILNVSFLTLLCFLRSCSSCTRTDDVKCTDGQLLIRAVAFTAADFNDAVAIKYKQDNAFDSVADSTSKVAYTADPYRYDTAEFAAYTTSTSDSIHRYFFTPGYDYKILLRAIGRTVTITNIVQTGETHHVFTSSASIIGRDRPLICYNSIISCTADGNTFTAANTDPGIIVSFVK